jgi:hypothetical protein
LDPLSLAICGYIALLLVYMFFGFPEWLSKYSGFSRTPANRELMGLGVANAVLLVAMLSKPVFHELSRKIGLLVVVAWTVLLVLSAVYLFAKWPVVPLQYLIAVSLAVASASYFLLCTGYGRTTLAVLVAVSVLSTGWFNPLVKGGLEIFSNSSLCRKILDIDAAKGGASCWAAFSISPEVPNIFRIIGVKALNGAYPYPQFELWKKIDPQQNALEVYNRYGYARFVPHGVPYVGFSLNANDSFTVAINPDMNVLGYLGVTHYLVTGLNTNVFDNSPILRRLFSFKNSTIYELVSPQRKVQ